MPRVSWEFRHRGGFLYPLVRTPVTQARAESRAQEGWRYQLKRTKVEADMRSEARNLPCGRAGPECGASLVVDGSRPYNVVTGERLNAK